MMITPTDTNNPPILILYLKSGLVLLTSPVALSSSIKPITVSMTPTTGKKPVIIRHSKHRFLERYLRLIIRICGCTQKALWKEPAEAYGKSHEKEKDS